MNEPDVPIELMLSIGKTLWAAGVPVIDDLHKYSYDWKIPDGISNDDKKLQAFKTQKYIEALKLLQPGVTMMIMHCTAPSEIFKQITDSGPLRKADLLAMLDPALKKALNDQGIIMSTWRELRERRLKIKE